MKSPEHKLAEPTNTISNTIARHDCVLLIAADADEAAKVLGELGSVTEERFQVEWVTELSRGIERLREGGVAAAVLDLNMLDLNMFDLYRVDRNLPGSQNAEILDQLFQAAPSVPILILSAAETEAAAREGVQRGAQDYLLKEQADGYRLRRAVRTMMDRHAAQAVALENEVANATLDSIGEAVLRTDIHGSLTYLNRVAENMTGWFREEALGRGPRREQGNVAAVLLDRVSNEGSTPQRPSPFGLPLFACLTSLPKPVKTTEGMARLRRLVRQANPWQRHPPFRVSRP